MIASGETAAVLLCAGLSLRYGEPDKLMAMLRGKPLAAHAADCIAGLGIARRIAVVRSGPAGAPLRALLSGRGFALVDNHRPEAGREVSLRLGLEQALAGGARAVLVCLGDMPDVGGEHLRALAAAACDDRAAMSWSGDWQGPPLVVPAALARQGLDDPGRAMRDILAAGDPALVPAPPGRLRDYDCAGDFPG